MFGTFFLKFWKQIVIALVILGAIWWVKNLYDTVEEQKVTITLQQATIKGLGEKIDEQNAAVDKLKTDTDARLAAAKVAIAAAQAKAKVNKQRATDINKATPKFPNDLCKSADALINEEIKK
jgi:Tfp pilus assembly protein PilN